MYIIWLSVWYLQTFLTSPSSIYLESHSRKCIFYFPFQPISVIAKTFNLASSSIEVRHLSVNFLWLFDCCERNFTIRNFIVVYKCRPSILVLSTESIYRDLQHVTTTPCNRGGRVMTFNSVSGISWRFPHVIMLHVGEIILKKTLHTYFSQYTVYKNNSI